MMRMRFVGGDARYITEVYMEEETSLYWDEQTKSIQDVLTRGRYNAKRRKILNEEQAKKNKLRTKVNDDDYIKKGSEDAC